jgi:hypothetical protein
VNNLGGTAARKGPEKAKLLYYFVRFDVESMFAFIDFQPILIRRRVP